MHHHLQLKPYKVRPGGYDELTNLHGLWTNRTGAPHLTVSSFTIFTQLYTDLFTRKILDHCPINYSIGVHNLVHLTPPAFSQTRKNFSVFMDAVSLSYPCWMEVPHHATVLVWRVTRCLGSQPTKVNPILLRQSDIDPWSRHTNCLDTKNKEKH
jgi:hypothetical protein